MLHCGATHDVQIGSLNERVKGQFHCLLIARVGANLWAFSLCYISMVLYLHSFPEPEGRGGEGI